jgi:ParB family transcriptional regulator, chromosome partitioning protein
MGAKMKEYSSSQEEVVMEAKTNTQVDEIKNLRLNQLVKAFISAREEILELA